MSDKPPTKEDNCDSKADEARYIAENAEYERRLALSLDPVAALDLRETMIDISETAYSAYWRHDLAFDLYAMLVGDPPVHYGNYFPNAEDVARLERLSAACGGWWVWGEAMPLFVTSQEWLVLYAVGPQRVKRQHGVENLR